MVNYREILRLTSLGYTQRQIAASVHSSRSTISEIQELARKADLSFPLDESVTNEVLLMTFHPERLTATNPRVEPDYSFIHKELATPGVNLSLLWTEYCEDAYSTGKTPYMYSQFCDKYRHWARLTKATMRIQHKPGDAMQVDWAGNTLKLYDRYTADTTDVYLFVAVLPCSCKAYVEACENMKSECWLSCHSHAYSYFGGVTRLLIPDNLKTGIVKNTRYETIINRSYQELAEYYGTAIVPCRVKRPQDKSLAEGSVKYASTWIIAALRNRKFFSMQEIQEAVTEKLEELNSYPFKKREGNRNTAYLEEEKSFMKPLPLTPYEPAVWSTAKVLQDYLITDGKNKYSVPFDLIGEQIDIRLTKNTVEAYYHGSRVASHPRLMIAQRGPVIQPEHMPQNHQKYLSRNEDEFRSWANTIGPRTIEVVEHFLTSGTEPEQGYKSCSSLTKLADRYGYDRLEKACERVLCYTSDPAIRNISTILKNGQDKVSVSTAETSSNSGGISRGPGYYKRGGAHND
jgi:transposase